MTLWSRALEVADEARLLLAPGRPNGTVSRAYDAMVFAARAAMEVIDPVSASAKKHAPLIGQFGRLIVRARGFDPTLGRGFNGALDLRLVANMERFITGLALFNEPSL